MTSDELESLSDCSKTRAVESCSKCERDSTGGDESGYGKSEGRQLMASDCLLLSQLERAHRSSSSKAAFSRGKKARSCYCAAQNMLSNSMLNTTLTPDRSGARQVTSTTVVIPIAPSRKRAAASG